LACNTYSSFQVKVKYLGTLLAQHGENMATIRKKAGKWGLIRRSFHKPISKTFISKQDAQRWARETERLIE
jgi:hypothetical protein